MKYKIGDWIVYTDKEFSNKWKKDYGFSLYGKIGKIIDIEKYCNLPLPYLLEFKGFINGHSGYRKGRDGHCQWCMDKEITLYKDYFKLKKFIEGEL